MTTNSGRGRSRPPGVGGSEAGETVSEAGGDRQDELEQAWFGDGADLLEKRRALLAADTAERAESRTSTTELLDLALSAVADRMTALAEVAADEGEVRRSHDTEPMLLAIEPDSEGWDDEGEPEPDFEPDVQFDVASPPPTPEKAAKTRAAKAAAAAAVEEAVREDALQTAAGTTPRGALEAEDAEILPPGVSGWQAEVELLYNDVLRLFSLGDTDGALVSLERLLIIAPINDQIRNFLRVNESKLMKLYEGVMGPWSNIPHRADSDHAPSFFKHHAKFKTILHLVDGRRDLGTILEESYFLPLETCAVLNQLIRSKVILAHDVSL